MKNGRGGSAVVWFGMFAQAPGFCSIPPGTVSIFHPLSQTCPKHIRPNPYLGSK